MSDQIKHECGIALVKLKKPLEFYIEKYGTPFYAMNKMYLMMEKQHNRGQDGAGIANIKFDVAPGNRYLFRKRSVTTKAIQDIFKSVQKKFKGVPKELLSDGAWMKENMPFMGELWLGHLRYGTYGGNSIDSCHPFVRQNNWMTRTLVTAGNFNLTNVGALFSKLVDLGQHPKEIADTVTVLEKIGHFQDQEVERLFRQYKDQGIPNREISQYIARDMDLQTILKRSANDWDGGYAMVGLMGHGDAFVLRDPNGIRPAFYYQNDEIVVVASERPVIQTAFNVSLDQVKELTPGHALIIKRHGDAEEKLVREPQEKKSCSFERIYFSRGSDFDIYRERKELGRLLAKRIIDEIDGELDKAVFSFIPNTAEIAFYGLIKGVEDHLDEIKTQRIAALGSQASVEKIRDILATRTKIEKVAIKDAKLRTFITSDNDRDDLVGHVYDVTYGTVRQGIDTLIVMDDSIVRGTTLKKSILKILDRLGPKKIIIVSSAPQIRYPDCYGIDMARLGDFAAFRAVIALHKERGNHALLQRVYEDAKLELTKSEGVSNRVKELYNAFTNKDIELKMAEQLRPSDIKAEVQIVFQSIEDLHLACPNHTGDWYFSGDYPTPGGMKVANRAYVNYFEGKNERAY
ncbi:MAG TPA: amidophosphoribosyltransferase [Luteibaculaceae bacterium]|nr:amidophosphoribosyltransferase [Luteibaculaceae bacterium]